MHEHYLREATAVETANLRARFDSARREVSCATLANELLAPQKLPAPRSLQLQRHTGLDEGPERL
jgi:hypothetical protein